MQERKFLMKNKSKFAFLSVAFAALLALGACQNNTPKSNNGKSAVSSLSVNSSGEVNSSDPINQSSTNGSSITDSGSSDISSSSDSSLSSSDSSSEDTPNTYRVIFVVDGVTVDTREVEPGSIVTYNGATPTKADADGKHYIFNGWSPDMSQPINQDTVFTAQFKVYSDVQMIDDFESYEDTPSMKDEGWTALGYSNATGQWSKETAASVSLGTRSEEGQQSLRFDAWENGVGYKFAKIFEGGEFECSANALQFRLMVPQINTVKVLLHAKMTIAGSTQTPAFHYTLNVPSSEFVEYTIPLSDSGWALWGEAGKSISWAADWLGVHEDDLLAYLTRIEFYIQGNDGANGLPYIAFLDSAKFITIDNPTLSQTENLKLNDRYTAKLNDDTTLRLDVGANGAATASVIDLETPVSVNGTLAVNGRDVTFTSNALTYNGILTNGGNLIKFVSASGSLKDLVDDVNLTGVQVLDNFDQYTSDGKSYYVDNPKNQRSGCRGAYYSEYFSNSASDSTEWGGDKWSLMRGNGDQLKLKQDAAGAHSGNNYLCLKNSQYNAMRYMQWGLYDGTAEQNSFRGNKFSFWARTNGLVPAFKVACYSQTSPKNATKDSYVKADTFACSAPIAEWTHYEIDLNPNVVYYGFLVFMEKNGSADSYLYIDDVEIYSADPYAHYEAPVEEALPTIIPGTYYLGAAAGLFNTSIGFLEDNSAYLCFGDNYYGSGTYLIDDREVAINVDNGAIVYTATMSDDATELIFKSVSGSNTDYVGILNNTNFTIADYADNAEYYENDGLMYYQGNQNEANISGARGAYYCDYQPGDASYTSPIGGSGWILMGGSGDQLKLNTTNPIQGAKSLDMKKSTAGAMRYLQWGLFKGTAQAHTLKTNFVVQVRNNADNATKVKVMVFKEQKVTAENYETSYVSKEVTLDAGAIDYVDIELDINETYYGYGIEFDKDSKVAYITVDNATYYSYYDETVSYLAPKDMVLNGKNGLDASIKFGDITKAFITYSAIGLNNTECSYRMTCGGGQGMIITVNGKEIEGSYVVSLDGTVTFTVTGVDPALSSYISVGAVFSNK